MCIILKYIIALLFAVLLTVAGCSFDAQKEMDEEEIEPQFDDIITESGIIDCTNIDYEIVELASLDSELKEKFAGFNPEERLVVVEDGEYQYVLIQAGRKPTAGYCIRIFCLAGYEDSIIIQALLNTPGSDENLEKVTTYPNLLLSMPVDNREIILILRDARQLNFA